jgi:hypothetical protein
MIGDVGSKGILKRMGYGVFSKRSSRKTAWDDFSA